MKNKIKPVVLAGVLIATSISPVFATNGSSIEDAFEEKFSNDYETREAKSNTGKSVEQAFEERFEQTEKETNKNPEKKTENYTQKNTQTTNESNYQEKNQSTFQQQAPRVEYVTVPSGDSVNTYGGGVTNPDLNDAESQSEKSYNISVKLTNAEGTIVKGVSVELLDGDTSLGKAQSNDEGIVKLNGIKKGSYVMKILSVPETYRSGQMLEVKVSEENQNSQMTFVVEYNKITLKNQTNTKTEYEIYDAYQDTLITKAESKSNGELVLNKVKPGLYYFKSGNVKSANLSVNDKYSNSTVTFSSSDAVITDDQTTIVRDGNSVNAEGENTTNLIKTGIDDKAGVNTWNVIAGLLILSLGAFSVYNLTEIKKLKKHDK
ncbi:SpaA isopeptide-forming pilin-related protein [Peptoniphilus sp.]|uniref:SpaA isopeptide-forming pilin-related protein n=1 Tax=Peptoniphilus sp. TaxID=1971214 RepID=UPI0039912E8A